MNRVNSGFVFCGIGATPHEHRGGLSSPQTVNWSVLSPAAHETAVVAAMRLLAGMTVGEVASLFREESDQLRSNEVPKSGRLTTTWVLARVKELRRRDRGGRRHKLEAASVGFSSSGRPPAQHGQ